MEDNKKPLLDIENDLLEMSKNIKIIKSLKKDIDEELIKNYHNNNITLIEDKYNKIKKQIQSFMNKKKFINNFIRNEKTVDNNKISEENDENENLIKENNKIKNVMETINKMQNKIKIQINELDNNLLKINFFEKQKKQKLVEEIELNDIKESDINDDSYNQKLKFKSSILNIKAQIYNEEKEELEKTNKIIEQIKQGTNDMKIITNSHNDYIFNLKNEHDYIGNNINKGISELEKNKNNIQNKNNKLIICTICLIIILLIMGFAIYYKIWKRK